MSIGQKHYYNLSKSAFYRHRKNRKRQRADSESDEFSDISQNERQGILQVEVLIAEGDATNTNGGNGHDEVYFDAYDVSSDESSEDDEISEYSDADDHSEINNGDVHEFSSDDDSGENFFNANELDWNELIYPGARITIGESMACTLKFYLRHTTTDTLLSHLIEFVEMFCPANNKCVKSLYFFRKWLGNETISLKKHFYCSECFAKLPTPDELCAVCPNPKSTCYFISISVENQLVELFKKPDFYNQLSYRFDRQKEDGGNYEDIYDGEIYRSYCTDDAEIDLRCQSNISFQWNSDGFSLYNSSKFSIWPQFCMINELPPQERKKSNNMILAGLWFGSNKPRANLFLEPFAEDLGKLREGISVYVEDLHQHMIVRGVTLCSTCDSPARAMFLNMQQYNAVYGCQKCKIQTETVNNVRAYQQTEELELRTTDETEEFAINALEEGHPVMGVKGPTLMSEILPDFIRFTTIDSMHLLMGLVKLLFKVWLSSEHRNHPASIWSHFKTVRERIVSITPPSFVKRLPRKIDDFAYWKASELITWLLMYSTVVLHDIMDTEYFSHHNLLVFGIYLLSQQSVSGNDIENAHRSLQRYVSDFERLYGIEFMTSNLHLLLHLSTLVRDYGPLWVFTCFPFENANGLLKLLVHATRDSQLQICKGVSSYLSLERLKKLYIREGSISEKFYQKLEKSGTHRRKLKYIGQELAIVGRAKKWMVIPGEIQQMLTQSGYTETSVYSFECLLKNGTVYSSQPYQRNNKKKTNSSYANFTADGEKFIGFIQLFLRVSNCSCQIGACDLCAETSKTLAIINKLTTRNNFSTSNPEDILDFIHALEDGGESVIIDVSQLNSVYFRIKISEKSYAIRPSCLWEKN